MGSFPKSRAVRRRPRGGACTPARARRGPPATQKPENTPRASFSNRATRAVAPVFPRECCGSVSRRQLRRPRARGPEPWPAELRSWRCRRRVPRSEADGARGQRPGPARPRPAGGSAERTGRLSRAGGRAEGEPSRLLRAQGGLAELGFTQQGRRAAPATAAPRPERPRAGGCRARTARALVARPSSPRSADAGREAERRRTPPHTQPSRAGPSGADGTVNPAAAPLSHKTVLL